MHTSVYAADITNMVQLVDSSAVVAFFTSAFYSC